MIETAMLIALGFFAATLIALSILPLLSRRAIRSAVARFEDRMPLSPSEIVAERDGIRAVAAVEQRRVEQKLERAAATTAAAEAALGRRTADLDAVERAREAVQAERESLSDDLARNRQTLSESAAWCIALEGTIADLRNRLRDEEQERRTVALRRDELDALAAERRETIEALQTRGAGLEARLGDRDAEIERGRAEQARLRTLLNEALRDRDLSRNESLLATTQRAILQDDLKDVTRRAEDYRVRLQAKSEALTTAERRVMEEMADRKAADAGFADLKRRFELLEARLIEAGGHAAQTLVEADLDALRASIVNVADDALQVLRPPELPPAAEQAQDLEGQAGQESGPPSADGGPRSGSTDPGTTAVREPAIRA